jgi:hypothetical protein
LKEKNSIKLLRKSNPRKSYNIIINTFSGSSTSLSPIAESQTEGEGSANRNSSNHSGCGFGGVNTSVISSRPSTNHGGTEPSSGSTTFNTAVNEGEGSANRNFGSHNANGCGFGGVNTSVISSRPSTQQSGESSNGSAAFNNAVNGLGTGGFQTTGAFQNGGGNNVNGNNVGGNNNGDRSGNSNVEHANRKSNAYWKGAHGPHQNGGKDGNSNSYSGKDGNPNTNNYGDSNNNMPNNMNNMANNNMSNNGGMNNGMNNGMKNGGFKGVSQNGMGMNQNGMNNGMNQNQMMGMSPSKGMAGQHNNMGWSPNGGGNMGNMNNGAMNQGMNGGINQGNMNNMGKPAMNGSYGMQNGMNNGMNNGKNGGWNGNAGGWSDNMNGQQMKGNNMNGNNMNGNPNNNMSGYGEGKGKDFGKEFGKEGNKEGKGTSMSANAQEFTPSKAVLTPRLTPKSKAVFPESDVRSELQSTEQNNERKLSKQSDGRSVTPTHAARDAPHAVGRTAATPTHVVGRSPTHAGRTPNHAGRTPNHAGRTPIHAGRTPKSTAGTPHHAGAPLPSGRTPTHVDGITPKSRALSTNTNNTIIVDCGLLNGRKVSKLVEAYPEPPAPITPGSQASRTPVSQPAPITPGSVVSQRSGRKRFTVKYKIILQNNTSNYKIVLCRSFYQHCTKSDSIFPSIGAESTFFNHFPFPF